MKNEHHRRWDNRNRGTGVDCGTGECDCMSDKLRQAAEMAYKALKNKTTVYVRWDDGVVEATEVLEEALTQALAEPDMGIDRGAWSDVPDATKWVDELRGDEEPESTQSQELFGFTE